MNGNPVSWVEQLNQTVRGLVTLSLVWAFIVLCLRGASIPESMLTILSVVVTFWFTSREQKASVAGIAAAVAAKNGAPTPAVPPLTPGGPTP
jgi:hypothetical protein